MIAVATVCPFGNSVSGDRAAEREKEMFDPIARSDEHGIALHHDFPQLRRKQSKIRRRQLC